MDRPALRSFADAVRARSDRWIERLRFTLDRAPLRVIAPGILFLSLFPFLIALIRMEVAEPLFGDTAMMQFTAWGIRHGLQLYRDTGTTDGPYIHFLQAAIQIVFGESDRALRVGDMVLQITGSALMGALLAPRKGLSPVARKVSQVVWAGVGVIVWMSYYLSLSWASTTNREAFYSVVGCAGMVALYVSGTLPDRAGRIAAFAGGFLSMSMCFGKATGVIFPAAGALALLIAEPELIPTRRSRIRMSLYGAGACVLMFALALLLFGSFRGYFYWSVEIPYIGNQFYGHMDWTKLLIVLDPDLRALAFGTLIIGAVAIGMKLLPGRALVFVVSPFLHWLSFCAQARGYPHQAIPIFATASLLGLVLAAHLWEIGSEERSVGILATVVVAFLGVHAQGSFDTSPFKWSGNPAEWDKPRNSFSDPEKEAGAFIKEHTKPDDTVFAYTNSPRGDNGHIVLYYAQRRTASPFLYEPWLDPIDLLPTSEKKPTVKELAALTAMQTRNRQTACDSVLRKHPAVIAYANLDRIANVCPPVRDMLQHDFQEAKVIADLHIFLRKPGS
jgi:hypothetical protein